MTRRNFSRILICVLVLIYLSGCAHHKIPVVLDHSPKQPYEVIQTVKTEVRWGGFQWIWFWWHYAPWYSSVYRLHERTLVKKAQKLDADAIVNIKYLPNRSGATAQAIRFKPEEAA